MATTRFDDAKAAVWLWLMFASDQSHRRVVAELQSGRARPVQEQPASKVAVRFAMVLDHDGRSREGDSVDQLRLLYVGHGGVTAMEISDRKMISTRSGGTLRLPGAGNAPVMSVSDAEPTP